jgi:hypothetical protein
MGLILKTWIGHLPVIGKTPQSSRNASSAITMLTSFIHQEIILFFRTS